MRRRTLGDPAATRLARRGLLRPSVAGQEPAGQAATRSQVAVARDIRCTSGGRLPAGDAHALPLGAGLRARMASRFSSSRTASSPRPWMNCMT